MFESSASMFARIRPLAEEGGHATRKKGEQAAKADLKRLKEFSRSSVTVKDLKTEKDHDFEYMDQVIQPEDNQEATFHHMGLPDMIEKFLAGYNVTFLAYGQTGTGKTHTMFGSKLDEVAEHDGESFPKDWGIFPRAVITALRQMKERGGRYVFSANVIEIYFFQVFDLLNEKKGERKNIYYNGADFDFSKVFEMEVETSADVDKMIKIMHTYRQSRGTNMNDTSSRSHCIACLNLMRIEGYGEERKVTKSTFKFVDLSGSERLEKTELEAKQSVDSWEGIATNWDLFHFGRTIQLCNEAAKKGKKVRTVRESILARVLKNTLDGEEIAAVVVTLSQSEKNGGETWCSLKFGDIVKDLQVKALPAEGKKLSHLVKEKRKELAMEWTALEKLGSTETGRNNKFYDIRRATVSQLNQTLKFMQKFEY